MRLFKLLSMYMLISLLSMNNLEAQLLKKLKNKVKEATEDVLAEKAAQEAEKTLDSILEADPEYQPEYEKQVQQMMTQGAENIKIEESYAFNTKVMYKMTVTDPDTSSDIKYEMWYAENEDYMATKTLDNKNSTSKGVPNSVLSILDDKNQAIIVILEAQKIAQLLPMDNIDEVDVDESGEVEDDTEFEGLKKTGRSKKILGYNCEEFVTQNDSNKYSFWITQELSLFHKNMLFNLSESLGANTFDHIPEEAKGFMMEMSYENFSKKEKGFMQVLDIEKTNNRIFMKDYQLMSLGQLMQK